MEQKTIKSSKKLKWREIYNEMLRNYDLKCMCGKLKRTGVYLNIRSGKGVLCELSIKKRKGIKERG